MYEVIHIYSVGSFLHYRESSALAPIIPINATSCFKMFEACRKLTTLDLSRFNTKNVVDMGSMFFECENLMSLNVSNFNTSKVTNMDYMFNYNERTHVHTSSDKCDSDLPMKFHHFGEYNACIGRYKHMIRFCKDCGYEDTKSQSSIFQ